MKYLAQSHGVLIVFCPMSKDQIVVIDKMRVQQIIFNLIQNSIKFSEKGSSVTVSMEQFPVPDNYKNIGVRIKVTDNGIGISKKDQKNLFKMFFKTQDEKSREKKQGSHGIGLNVCKRFA